MNLLVHIYTEKGNCGVVLSVTENRLLEDVMESNLPVSLQKCDCCLKKYMSMDGQTFSYFITELKRSHIFRKSVLNNIWYHYRKSGHSCNEDMHLHMNLTWPSVCILDSSWSRRIQTLASQLCELETAMAWLSTLGGGYSSLGDSSLDFAHRAGETALLQLQIASKLGDKVAMSQCKLYMAMSLLQRRDLASVKCIVKKEYKFANSSASAYDTRLINICQCIWSRVQYLEKEKRKIPSVSLFHKTSNSTECEAKNDSIKKQRLCTEAQKIV